MASNKRESKVIKDPTLKHELLNIKEKEINKKGIAALQRFLFLYVEINFIGYMFDI